MTGGASPVTRQDVLGLPLDAITMTQAVDRCTSAVDRGGYLSVGMVNAAKVIAMRRNPGLRQAVTGCDMVLPDGQSVVWASRLLGSPLPERVAGIDLFFRLLGEAARRAYRVYFLGAQADVLVCLLAEVHRSYPGLAVAGAHDGYFRGGDEPAIAAEIRESGADLLFVGMPSPRKELFLRRWGQHTGVSVAHGVGGSFDVLAGLTRRAPLWWQDHGMEWLYRALQEPGRLGRRYLTTNASFLALVAGEVIRQRLAAGTGSRPGGTGGRPAARGPAVRQGRRF